MIDYDEGWLLPLLFKLEGSVYIRSAMWSMPACLLTFALVLLLREYPDITKDTMHTLDLSSLASGHLWTALTAVLTFMVSFRTRQGLARFWEGTGLLHQMKGEWFDTVSNCVTFTIGSNTDDTVRVQSFRHTLVRLMSLCHGSALEEISNMGSQMETIDVMGLNSATLRHLKDCVENHHFNKVEVLLHLVQSLITDAHHAGILKVPPPVLSRVYQTISRGYVNLLNTKKITDTKFPFPYVQLIVLLLLIHTFLTPLVVAVSIDSIILAPIVAFIPVFGTHSMNFIAMELEDPFGMDDNDLPLNGFQEEMNSCLLMLLHPNTDLIAGINAERCVMDFYELKNSIYAGKGFDDETSFRDSVPVTAKLFDPTFRVMNTNQNLEVAAQSMSSNEEEEEEEQKETDERTPEPLPMSQQTKFFWKEPKTPLLGHDEGLNTETKELEGVLSQSMEDFNRSLQSWTQTMENQVKELNHGFRGLSELVNAGPSKSRLQGREGPSSNRNTDGMKSRGDLVIVKGGQGFPTQANVRVG